MHFIHLSVNSISKKEEIDHLAELTNASVIDISLTKVDGSALNSEMVTESCCIVLQKGLVLLLSLNTFLLTVIKPKCVLTRKVFFQRYIYQNKSHLKQVFYLDLQTKSTFLITQIKSLDSSKQRKPKNVTFFRNVIYVYFYLKIKQANFSYSTYPKMLLKKFCLV